MQVQTNLDDKTVTLKMNLRWLLHRLDELQLARKYNLGKFTHVFTLIFQ